MAKCTNEEFQTVCNAQIGVISTPVYKDYLCCHVGASTDDSVLTRLPKFYSILLSKFQGLKTNQEWVNGSTKESSFVSKPHDGVKSHNSRDPSSWQKNTSSRVPQAAREQPLVGSSDTWKKWFDSRECGICGGSHPTQYHDDLGARDRPKPTRPGTDRRGRAARAIPVLLLVPLEDGRRGRPQGRRPRRRRARQPARPRQAHPPAAGRRPGPARRRAAGPSPPRGPAPPAWGRGAWGCTGPSGPGSPPRSRTTAARRRGPAFPCAGAGSGGTRPSLGRRPRARERMRMAAPGWRQRDPLPPRLPPRLPVRLRERRGGRPSGRRAGGRRGSRGSRAPRRSSRPWPWRRTRGGGSARCGRRR